MLFNPIYAMLVIASYSEVLFILDNFNFHLSFIAFNLCSRAKQQSQMYFIMLVCTHVQLTNENNRWSTETYIYKWKKTTQTE